MFLSSVAIMGALGTGALGTVVNVYRENKRQREMPWTVYAEKVERRRKKRLAGGAMGTARWFKEKSPSFARTPFSLPSFLAGDLRSQQLEAISSAADESEVSDAQKREDRKLVISLTSLLFATSGALLYPPLSLLTIPGVIYVSLDLYKKTYQSLVKERKMTPDLVDAILNPFLIVGGHYFLCNILLFYYVIRKRVLNKIKDNSSKSLIDVFRQQPRFVWILTDGIEIEVPFESLKPGDYVVVTAGKPIPVDGSVVTGMASVDQHILTGESQPVDKGVGDQVFALTIVLSGRICVEVEKTGSQTTAAEIGELLNQTVDMKTDLQLKAEARAEAMLWPTLLLSGLVLPILGPWSSLALLYTPPVNRIIIAGASGTLNFLNLASRKGILIKDGRTLELLNEVDTVVFDKTGTLTEEQPHIGQIHTCNGVEMNEVLRLAAAAEHKQKHPIARAILQEAKARELSLPAIDEAEYKVGYGLKVTVNSQLVRVGSIRFIEICEITIPPTIREAQAVCHSQGHSLVLVAVDSQVIGAIELHATVRQEAKSIIQGLRARNIDSMYIISGDHEAPTKRLAASLGIEHYFAETLPENKADLIAKLQEEGKSICYVGDGINDAIALKKANVSISLRGAATIATDTAQVILMDESLNQLCHLFDLAGEFKSNAKSTFSIIFYPNLAVFVGVLFFHLGFVPSMLLGQLSFLSGLGNTMLPWHKHRKELGINSKQ